MVSSIDPDTVRTLLNLTEEELPENKFTVHCNIMQSTVTNTEDLTARTYFVCWKVAFALAFVQATRVGDQSYSLITTEIVDSWKQQYIDRMRELNLKPLGIGKKNVFLQKANSCKTDFPIDLNEV